MESKCRPNSRGVFVDPRMLITAFGVYLVQIRMFHRLYYYIMTFYLDFSLVT